jgi:hypothetical protein
MFNSVFRGSSYDRSGKHRDGEHELSGTVGSSRRRTLPPHDCANVEFVLRDLENCCDGDGNENANEDGGGDAVGQKVSVDISNLVPVPVPVHVHGLGQRDISEAR